MTSSVLEPERERQAFWADLGLPDPVRVLTETHRTEQKTGEHFTHPGRAALADYLAAHPDKKPHAWDDDPHLFPERKSK